MTIQNRRIAGFLVAVSMLVASGPGMAAKEVHPSCGPPGTWCSLGKVTAGRDKDRDTIEIKGSDDEFRALKFKVKDSPINIHRLVVTYDNGCARGDQHPQRDSRRAARAATSTCAAAASAASRKSSSGTTPRACSAQAAAW